MDERNGTQSQDQSSGQVEATPDTGKGLLPEDQAARAKRYARLLIGHGVGAGAFAVVAVVFLADYIGHGAASRVLIVGIFSALVAVAQAVAALVRYRQLCRYLRTGSGSKYEDLVRATEKPPRPPEA